MTIKLRVVGIFYSVELDAKSVSGGSVQDVLDAAVKNPGSDRKFGYISSVGTLEPPSLSLSTFSAVYNSPFKSKVSGIEYPKGSYVLAEDINARPSYTVWQYYVFDEKNERVKLPTPTAPYTTDIGIKDCYTVIWRLVSVLAGPTNTSPSKLKQLHN